MKKYIFWLFCFTLFTQLLIAQSREEERRVEEEKRKALKPTETKQEKEPRAIPLPKGVKPASPISLLDKAYFAELITRRVAFRYDICKVIVILMGKEDEYIDLGAQITYLRENKFLPKKYQSDPPVGAAGGEPRPNGREAGFDAMKPLRKGLMAYVFYRALKIKGGLILKLFGPNERYALKELVYQGIMPEGTTGELVSGEELIAILTNAANYKAKKSAQVLKPKPAPAREEKKSLKSLNKPHSEPKKSKEKQSPTKDKNQ